MVPYDDPTILPDHQLVRRISQNYVVADGRGGRRLSSMAFKPSSGPNGGMSVDLATRIAASGLDVVTFVVSDKFPAAVQISAGDVRGLAFKVGSDPTEDNPFHGQVWGHFGRSEIRKLQGICVWFVRMKDVDLF